MVAEGCVKTFGSFATFRDSETRRCTCLLEHGVWRQLRMPPTCKDVTNELRNNFLTECRCRDWLDQIPATSCCGQNDQPHMIDMEWLHNECKPICGLISSTWWHLKHTSNCTEKRSIFLWTLCWILVTFWCWRQAVNYKSRQGMGKNWCANTTHWLQTNRKVLANRKISTVCFLRTYLQSIFYSTCLLHWCLWFVICKIDNVSVFGDALQFICVLGRSECADKLNTTK